MSQSDSSSAEPAAVVDGSAPHPASGLRARILARFARVTGSGTFIPEMDGLRFVAISTVVLFHLLQALRIKSPALYESADSDTALGELIGQWFHGVDLFFIISGFILALPFASHYLSGTQRVPLGKYFLRRLTRLEPPYILSLLLLFGLRVLLRDENADDLSSSLGASLLYSHNLIFGAPSFINTVAWSLEVEIQFYLLVPLLTGVFAIPGKTLRRTVMAVVIMAWTIAAWKFTGPTQPRVYLSILRFMPFFLTGFLLADFYLCEWRGRKIVRDFRWDVVSLVGWLLVAFLWVFHRDAPLLRRPFPEGDSFITAVLFPPLALLCYAAAFRGVVTNWIFTNGWITAIGGMCYSIYLLHNQLITLAVSVTRDLPNLGPFALNFLLQSLIVTPIVLLPCAAYFLLIERPCMQRDWPSRLARWVRETVTGSVPAPRV